MLRMVLLAEEGIKALLLFGAVTTFASPYQVVNPLYMVAMGAAFIYQQGFGDDMLFG